MTKQELMKKYPAEITEILCEKLNIPLSIEQFVSNAIKESILVTEDRESIFYSMQPVFCINARFGSFEEDAIDCKSLLDGCKCFSTPEARSHYIVLNKPLTSVEQQMEAIFDSGVLLSDHEYQKIKDCLTERAKKEM